MSPRKARAHTSTPATLARRAAVVALVISSFSVIGCGSKAAPAAAACDQTCLDGIALRSVRLTMKLVFNLKLQGKPVGPVDETTPCPEGGTARVYGMASSNPVQGATMIDLTYELDACHYLSKDTTPEKNFDMSVTGTFTEKGTLAVQPSATTALLIGGSGVALAGTVDDPPIGYSQTNCSIAVTQDGNAVNGQFCGRLAAFTF